MIHSNQKTQSSVVMFDACARRLQRPREHQRKKICIKYLSIALISIGASAWLYWQLHLCTALKTLIFVFQRHSQLFSNSNFFLNELNMIDELLCSIASGRAHAHFFDDCRSVYASTKAACCLWFCAAECFGRLLCVIANRKQHKKHIKEIFLKAMLFFSPLFRCRTNIYYNKQAKRLIGVCVYANASKLQ